MGRFNVGDRVMLVDGGDLAPLSVAVVDAVQAWKAAQ